MQQTSTFQIYNASAGSGKTFTLVKEYLKIILVSDDIFVFQKILAVTFTNKAAAELRHRIRSRLEELLATSSEPTTREKLDLSLTKLDDAAISTLHRFARRLLTEHS